MAFEAVEVERVARLHGDERGRRGRRPRRAGASEPGTTTRAVGDRSSSDAAGREVEMVEMLVRDEQPVDALGASARGGGGMSRCSCGLTHGSTTTHVPSTLDAGSRPARATWRAFIGDGLARFANNTMIFDSAGLLHCPPSRVASAPPAGAGGGSSSLTDRASTRSSQAVRSVALLPVLARDELGQLLDRGLGRRACRA